VRLALGVSVAAAAPCAQGAAIELGAVDAFQGWGGILLLIGVPWLVALLVSIALAVRGEMHPVIALSIGLALGFLAGVFLLVGDFAPFALELRGRHLTDFGDALEIGWNWVLIGLLVFVGTFGAAAGAVCGPLIWAAKRRLGGPAAGQPT
jgi:hypothetical protein